MGVSRALGKSLVSMKMGSQAYKHKEINSAISPTVLGKESFPVQVLDKTTAPANTWTVKQ